MLSLVVSLIRENRSSQSCRAKDTASDDGDNRLFLEPSPPGAVGSLSPGWTLLSGPLLFLNTPSQRH